MQTQIQLRECRRAAIRVHLHSLKSRRDTNATEVREGKGTHHTEQDVQHSPKKLLLGKGCLKSSRHVVRLGFV